MKNSRKSKEVDEDAEYFLVVVPQKMVNLFLMKSD